MTEYTDSNFAKAFLKQAIKTNDSIFQDIKYSQNKVFPNIACQINSHDSHKIWAGCDNILFLVYFYLQRWRILQLASDTLRLTEPAKQTT